MDASDVERRRIKSKLGFEPLSMMWINPRNKALDKLVADTLASEKHPYHEHDYSVRAGALSQFPTEVAERVIKFWSERGDRIFNPFMERMPHLIIANHLGRHAFGYDISHEAFEHDKKRLKRLVKQTLLGRNEILVETKDSMKVMLNDCIFNIYRRDSRNTHFPNDNFDLIFGSPAYWDLEYYGSEPEQLGYKKSYRQFLFNMKQVAKECYRILKPGKFLIWAVNDFRVKNKFYLYHMDTFKLLEEVGFIPHDIVVYNLSKHPLHAIFITQLQERKQTAKTHEYLAILRKPKY